jgi:hypothetical protein
VRPFCLVMALLVCSSSMAEEPRPSPSTAAKVVKGLDWTTVSLLSAGLVLQSASLLSSNGRPALEDPLFTAFVVSFLGGAMTGLVSFLVRAVTKRSSPVSDVPGPYELVLAPSRAGRVVQTTGIVFAMVGLLSYVVGNAFLDFRLASRRAASWLQIGGGLTAAAGMMGAMVGGELREAPTLSVAPTSGGAVVGLSGQW